MHTGDRDALVHDDSSIAADVTQHVDFDIPLNNDSCYAVRRRGGERERGERREGREGEREGRGRKGRGRMKDGLLPLISTYNVSSTVTIRATSMIIKAQQNLDEPNKTK